MTIHAVRRFFDALTLFLRTPFTWRTAWRHARPLGGWYSTADKDGNVRIVPGVFR